MVANPTRSTDLSSLLLRTACHELRTPVASLAALTRAMAEQGEVRSAADRRDLAVLAHDLAIHLTHLVDRTATASRDVIAAGIGGHRLPLRRVVATATTVVPASRLRVRLAPAAARRPVDAGRFRQILINLLDNAVRHGPPDGPVRLSATLRAGRLEIVIGNDIDAQRTGTPAESCDRLRAALRRAEPPAGFAGLGLWIVGSLATLDGGWIEAYPVASRAVAVRLVLPPPRRGRRCWPPRAAVWPRRVTGTGSPWLSRKHEQGVQNVQPCQRPAVRGQTGRA